MGLDIGKELSTINQDCYRDNVAQLKDELKSVELPESLLSCIDEVLDNYWQLAKDADKAIDILRGVVL